MHPSLYRAQSSLISLVVVPLLLTNNVLRANSGLSSLDLTFLEGTFTDINKNEEHRNNSDESLSLPQTYLDQLTSYGRSASTSPFEVSPFGINWLSRDELEISEDPNLTQVQEVLSEIQKKAKFLTQFDGRDLLAVPFGIKGEYGQFSYEIGFDNLR
ncbi:MAG: hypothetical protein OEQ53_21995, partial [Saprospiraceae bacterium]|nr:hypothetical protein [Saprospiraceae bacterium]